MKWEGYWQPLVAMVGGQHPRFSLPSIPCLEGDKVGFRFELQVGGSTFGVVPNLLGGGVQVGVLL